MSNENEFKPEPPPEHLLMENPKDKIEIDEIAAHFGITHQEAFCLVKSRYFPSIKLGAKTYIIPRNAFFKFVQDPEYIIRYKVRGEDYEKEFNIK